MQISKHLHHLKIPFQVPISPEIRLDRFVNILLLYGETEVVMIDSGVAGAEGIILLYLRQSGRQISDLREMILSHSHPDHIGAARLIQAETGCLVHAHPAERDWIEDPDLQARIRPVPGFHSLVGGPVSVDRQIEDGSEIEFGSGLIARAIHTPGHSPGSISLQIPTDSAIFTGDAIPVPGDLPIFTNWQDSIDSLNQLEPLIRETEILLSSWAAPVVGARKDEIVPRSLAWLHRIKETVIGVSREIEGSDDDPLALCRATCARLNLPPVAVNPLVARSFAACLS